MVTSLKFVSPYLNHQAAAHDRDPHSLVRISHPNTPTAKSELEKEKHKSPSLLLQFLITSWIDLELGDELGREIRWHRPAAHAPPIDIARFGNQSCQIYQKNKLVVAAVSSSILFYGTFSFLVSFLLLSFVPVVSWSTETQMDFPAFGKMWPTAVGLGTMRS